MRLKRRHLLLGGLSGLGLVGVAKSLSSPKAPSLDPTSISAGRNSEGYGAVPASPQPTSQDMMLRFVAVADTGAGDANQFAVGDAMAKYRARSPYNLVALAGDNIYTNGEMERIGVAFEQPYAALLKQGVRFQACLGNHDIRTANGNLQVSYPDFNMKGRYYTYREKDVQFFVLDTNTNVNWKPQLAWLQQELSRSTAPWKIVYGHHPIYSSGVYGTDRAMISMLAPLFKQYGVQLYMNGHEHHYERTSAIDGTTYLVTGIGGASLRPVGRSKWTEHSVSRFGFSAIEVYPDRLEIAGVGSDGVVFDRGIVRQTASARA